MPQPAAGDVYVNLPLTDISIAYVQKATNFVADQVFPLIPVERQSGRYFEYQRDDWFRSQAQLRGPSSESAGSGWQVDSTPTYYTPVYAVHKDIDDQIRANQMAPIDMDRDATIWVTQQLLLKRELIFAGKYMSSGVWTGGDLTGVSGTPSGAQFKQWDQATSTPIEDITNQIIVVAALTGFKPNTLVLAPKVFNTLRNHAEIQDRVKYGASPGSPSVVTEQAIAALCGLEKVLVPYGVQATAVEGQATQTYDFIHNSKGGLLCYSNPTPAIMQPSAGYTFSWTGYLGAGNAGNRIKSFRMEWLGSDRVEGELAFDCELVATDLGVWFGGAIA